VGLRLGAKQSTGRKPSVELREKRWQPALLNVIAAVDARRALKQWGFVRANARAAKLSILIITQAAGIPVDAIANLIHMTTETRENGTSALGKFTLATTKSTSTPNLFKSYFGRSKSTRRSAPLLIAPT